MKRRSFLKALGAILPASLLASKASAESEPGAGIVSDNDWAVITEPDLSGPKYIVTSKNNEAKARAILEFEPDYNQYPPYIDGLEEITVDPDVIARKMREFQRASEKEYDELILSVLLGNEDFDGLPPPKIKLRGDK